MLFFDELKKVRIPGAGMVVGLDLRQSLALEEIDRLLHNAPRGFVRVVAGQVLGVQEDHGRSFGLGGGCV